MVPKQSDIEPNKFYYNLEGKKIYTEKSLIEEFPPLKNALKGKYATFVIPLEYNEFAIRSLDLNKRRSIEELLNNKKLKFRIVQEEVIQGLIKSFRIYINESSVEQISEYYG